MALVSYTLVYSIEIHNIDPISRLETSCYQDERRVQLELIHDQLPLAVPCYDLLLVIELTVRPRKVVFRALPTPLS